MDAAPSWGQELEPVTGASSVSWRLLSVVDTREFIEVDDGKWVAVSGSGSLRPCDRCGRSHEIHATMEDSEGNFYVVGVGCAKQASPELDAALKAGQSAATTLAKNEAEVAALRERLDTERRVIDEVGRLSFPGYRVVQREGHDWWESVDGKARVGTFIRGVDPKERESLLTSSWQEAIIRERLNAMGWKSWRAGETGRRLEEAEKRLRRSQKKVGSLLVRPLIAAAFKTAGQWQIDGLPYRTGEWIEVRGLHIFDDDGPFPCRRVVGEVNGKYAWEVYVPVGFGPNSGKVLTGTAKTLDAAKDKAMAATKQDDVANAKYSEQVKRLVGSKTAGSSSADVEAWVESTGTSANAVARIDGVPVGYLGAEQYAGEPAHVEVVYVKEEYRRQGIATKMLRAVEQAWGQTLVAGADLSIDGAAWSNAVTNQPHREPTTRQRFTRNLLDQMDRRSPSKRSGSLVLRTAQREGDTTRFGKYRLVYTTQDMGEQKPRHVITAYDGELKVGELNWYGKTGTIHHIEVEPEYLRQGIATAMWEWGQTMRPAPKHSADRTTQGDAWARQVGGTLPRRMTKRVAASTQTIYRGVRVDLPTDLMDKIVTLLGGPREQSEIGQHLKVGPMIVEWLEKHHWESGVGLGRHWSTRREMAETAAYQGARSGLGVLLEATYQPNDVNPQLTHTDRGWAESESEVNIKPGARLTLTGVYLPFGRTMYDDENLLGVPIKATASAGKTYWRALNLQVDASTAKSILDALNSGNTGEAARRVATYVEGTQGGYNPEGGVGQWWSADRGQAETGYGIGGNLVHKDDKWFFSDRQASLGVMLEGRPGNLIGHNRAEPGSTVELDAVHLYVRPDDYANGVYVRMPHRMSVTAASQTFWHWSFTGQLYHPWLHAGTKAAALERKANLTQSPKDVAPLVRDGVMYELRVTGPTLNTPSTPISDNMIMEGLEDYGAGAKVPYSGRTEELWRELWRREDPRLLENSIPVLKALLEGRKGAIFYVNGSEDEGSISVYAPKEQLQIVSQEHTGSLHRTAEATGDCYEAAGRYILDEVDRSVEDRFWLCHGFWKTGSTPGSFQFSHAWVEYLDSSGTTMVIDTSNGRYYQGRRDDYYRLGNISPSKVVRYTPTEARVQMLRHRHWGPWDSMFDKTASATGPVVLLGKSPLKYDYAGMVQRIAIIDQSAQPPLSGWTYFTTDRVEDNKSRKRRSEWDEGRGTTQRKPAPKYKEGTGTAEEGMVAFLDFIESSHEIFIAYMAVRDDYRGRGLAKQLVDWVYAKARRDGKQAVDWGTVFYPANQMYWKYEARTDLGVTTVGRPLDRRISALHHAAGQSYWRVHDPRNKFSPENAASIPLTDRDETYGDPRHSMFYRPGYSAMENPWHLWAYLIVMGWIQSGFVQNNEVIEFSGREVTRADFDKALRDAPSDARDWAWGANSGRGLDGEVTVIPDMNKVRRMSWSDFTKMLVRTPMPSDTGDWRNSQFKNWGQLAAALMERGYDDPVSKVVIDKFGPKK